jgi:hypothetical protein
MAEMRKAGRDEDGDVLVVQQEYEGKPQNGGKLQHDLLC